MGDGKSGSGANLKPERYFRTRQGVLLEEALLIFCLTEGRFPDQGLGGRNREIESGFVRIRRDEDRSSDAASGVSEPG